MRVVYLAHSDPSGPTSRFRVYQYRRFFVEAGVELEVLPAFDRAYYAAEGSTGLTRAVARVAAQARALVRRLGQLPPALRGSALVVEREVFPRSGPLGELLLAALGPGYVLELDDAVYLSAGRRWSYSILLSLARGVIAGNETLAAHARRFNARVAVVPTTIDMGRYTEKTSYRLADPPRIGWVGLASNFGQLATVAAALERVRRRRGAELWVMSARPPDLGLPVRFVPWREEDEAAFVSALDVGIMPLPDTPFARGKCGLKLLQYLAGGVPAVASPVGVNAEILHHDENGMLASDPADWEKALDELLGDERLRERLGRAGRATVESKYSTAVWGPRLADLYRAWFGGEVSHPPGAGGMT